MAPTVKWSPVEINLPGYGRVASESQAFNIGGTDIRFRMLGRMTKPPAYELVAVKPDGSMMELAVFEKGSSEPAKALRDRATKRVQAEVEKASKPKAPEAGRTVREEEVYREYSSAQEFAMRLKMKGATNIRLDQRADGYWVVSWNVKAPSEPAKALRDRATKRVQAEVEKASKPKLVPAPKASKSKVPEPRGDLYEITTSKGKEQVQGEVYFPYGFRKARGALYGGYVFVDHIPTGLSLGSLPLSKRDAFLKSVPFTDAAKSSDADVVREALLASRMSATFVQKPTAADKRQGLRMVRDALVKALPGVTFEPSSTKGYTVISWGKVLPGDQEVTQEARPSNLNVYDALVASFKSLGAYGTSNADHVQAQKRLGSIPREVLERGAAFFRGTGEEKAQGVAKEAARMKAASLKGFPSKEVTLAKSAAAKEAPTVKAWVLTPGLIVHKAPGSSGYALSHEFSGMRAFHNDAPRVSKAMALKVGEVLAKYPEVWTTRDPSELSEKIYKIPGLVPFIQRNGGRAREFTPLETILEETSGEVQQKKAREAERERIIRLRDPYYPNPAPPSVWQSENIFTLSDHGAVAFEKWMREAASEGTAFAKFTRGIRLWPEGFDLEPAYEVLAQHPRHKDWRVFQVVPKLQGGELIYDIDEGRRATLADVNRIVTHGQQSRHPRVRGMVELQVREEEKASKPTILAQKAVRKAAMDFADTRGLKLTNFQFGEMTGSDYQWAFESPREYSTRALQVVWFAGSSGDLSVQEMEDESRGKSWNWKNVKTVEDMRERVSMALNESSKWLMGEPATATVAMEMPEAKPGTKIYLQGTTYPQRIQLRKAGFEWDRDRKAWWTDKPTLAQSMAQSLGARVETTDIPAPPPKEKPKKGKDKLSPKVREGLDKLVAGLQQHHHSKRPHLYVVGKKWAKIGPESSFHPGTLAEAFLFVDVNTGEVREAVSFKAPKDADIGVKVWDYNPLLRPFEQKQFGRKPAEPEGRKPTLAQSMAQSLGARVETTDIPAPPPKEKPKKGEDKISPKMREGLDRLVVGLERHSKIPGEKFAYVVGKRWAKVGRKARDRDKPGEAFLFVDVKTGEVRRAASWSQPRDTDVGVDVWAYDPAKPYYSQREIPTAKEKRQQVVDKAIASIEAKQKAEPEGRKLGVGREDYEERKEARIERLEERAAKKKAEAEARWQSSGERASRIPLGQPILKGHHSEKRHRRDIERIQADSRKSVEARREAEELERRAAAAEASGAISSDDPKALEKLQKKLAYMEAQREQIKRFSRLARKGDQEAISRIAKYLGPSASYHKPEKGYPSYVLSNLGANIRRVKERIEELEKRAERTARQTEIGDWEIVENPDVNRTQMRTKYDRRATDEEKKALKSYGFRWSRNEGAWQRQISNAAWYAAEQVAKISEKAGGMSKFAVTDAQRKAAEALMKRAEPFRTYGDLYDRGVDNSANRLHDFLGRADGRSGVDTFMKELRVRVEAAEKARKEREAKEQAAAAAKREPKKGKKKAPRMSREAREKAARAAQLDACPAALYQWEMWHRDENTPSRELRQDVQRAFAPVLKSFLKAKKAGETAVKARRGTKTYDTKVAAFKAAEKSYQDAIDGMMAELEWDVDFEGEDVVDARKEIDRCARDTAGGEASARAKRAAEIEAMRKAQGGLFAFDVPKPESKKAPSKPKAKPAKKAPSKPKAKPAKKAPSKPKKPSRAAKGKRKEMTDKQCQEAMLELLKRTPATDPGLAKHFGISLYKAQKMRRALKGKVMRVGTRGCHSVYAAKDPIARSNAARMVHAKTTCEVPGVPAAAKKAKRRDKPAKPKKKAATKKRQPKAKVVYFA